MVSIKGIDKAKVLVALWQHSHAQGLSFLGLRELTLFEAEEMINDRNKKGIRLYFDYVNGHVIKCDITNDEFDESLYDRDCGSGAAQRAIDSLRKDV